MNVVSNSSEPYENENVIETQLFHICLESNLKKFRITGTSLALHLMPKLHHQSQLNPNSDSDDF